MNARKTQLFESNYSCIKEIENSQINWIENIRTRTNVTDYSNTKQKKIQQKGIEFEVREKMNGKKIDRIDDLVIPSKKINDKTKLNNYNLKGFEKFIQGEI